MSIISSPLTSLVCQLPHALHTSQLGSASVSAPQVSQLTLSGANSITSVDSAARVPALA